MKDAKELTLLEKIDYCTDKLENKYIIKCKKDEFTDESTLSVTSKDSYLHAGDEFVDVDFRDVSQAAKHFWRQSVLDEKRAIIQSMSFVEGHFGYYKSSSDDLPLYLLYVYFKNYSHHRDISEMKVMFKKDNGELLKLTEILTDTHEDGEYLLSPEFEMPLLSDCAVFSLSKDDVQFIAQAKRFSVRFENVIANGACYFSQEVLDEINFLTDIDNTRETKADKLYEALLQQEAYDAEQNAEIEEHTEPEPIELGDSERKKKKEIVDAISANYRILGKDWFSKMVELPASATKGNYYRVLNSISVKKVIDLCFWENPNLTQQYAPANTGGSSGSKVMDAVIDTYTEVKKNNQILAASEESAACACLYLKEGDFEHYYVDVMFFNKSFLRECKYASLTFGEKQMFSPELGSWNGSNKNEFYNLLTFQLPSDLLKWKQDGSLLTLTFDETEKGDPGVFIEMKLSFNQQEYIALELARLGEENWTKGLIDKGHNLLFPYFAMKKIEDINFSNPSVLRDFINNPFSFKEIKEYRDYCDESNRTSSFIDYCKDIETGKYNNINTIKEDIEKNRINALKGPSRFILTYILLEIVGLVVCFLIDYLLGWYIPFFTLNVLATYCFCRMSYEQEIKTRYNSQKEADNQSNRYALWCGVFVVLHVILGIILLSTEEQYEPAGASLVVLVVGCALSYFLVKKYNPSKQSEETQKLAQELQWFTDKVK